MTHRRTKYATVLALALFFSCSSLIPWEKLFRQRSVHVRQFLWEESPTLVIAGMLRYHHVTYTSHSKPRLRGLGSEVCTNVSWVEHNGRVEVEVWTRNGRVLTEYTSSGAVLKQWHDGEVFASPPWPSPPPLSPAEVVQERRSAHSYISLWGLSNGEPLPEWFVSKAAP